MLKNVPVMTTADFCHRECYVQAQIDVRVDELIKGDPRLVKILKVRDRTSTALAHAQRQFYKEAERKLRPFQKADAAVRDRQIKIETLVREEAGKKARLERKTKPKAEMSD